jgi:hypothetical protein
MDFSAADIGVNVDTDGDSGTRVWAWTQPEAVLCALRERWQALQRPKNGGASVGLGKVPCFRNLHSLSQQ